MTAPDEIRFGQVLRQLLNERFRNRRKDFARSIHVSESALSQYVRGKATPSLSVLVAIARALDVSLDHLVFGIEPEQPSPYYGDLVTHVEEAIAGTQFKAARLRDFVGRVGSALAKDIEETATRILAENTAVVLGGGLTESEVRDLESISTLIRIATVDLDMDALPLTEAAHGEQPEESAVARHDVARLSFTPVIRHNVMRGSEYHYVIPDGSEWRRTARRLRDAVGTADGFTKTLADRRLKFFASPHALVPGYVMYTVDFSLVTAGTARLLDRISDFVDESSCVVALTEPPSLQSRYYSLIDRRHHRRMIEDHDLMTRSCPRLAFD